MVENETGEIEDGPYLHPEYRRYGNNKNDEFEYLMRLIIEQSNPLQTCFKERYKEDLIHDIYTVSDEACGFDGFVHSVEDMERTKVT